MSIGRTMPPMFKTLSSALTRTSCEPWITRLPLPRTSTTTAATESSRSSERLVSPSPAEAVDEIRTHLSKGLGFSKEDRDTNIRRVGYVAGLVAQHGGTTLCSVISPYRAIRDEARKMSKGNFVEVFCDTPLDVCEKRDVKGMYAKARAAVAEGKPMGFTGVDDPYEPPTNPEVTIDTGRLSVQQCVDAIVAKLLELGYVLPHGHIVE